MNQTRTLTSQKEDVAPGRNAKKRHCLWRFVEVRVLLFVAGIFLLLELCLWGLGEKLSKDIAHLQSFPEIANEVKSFAPENGTEVLFLGNSLTRYGVDEEVYAQGIEEEIGLPIQSVKMNPDNTDLSDWFYAYRTYFLNQKIVPDLLIIGFEGIHLRDAKSRHPDRLAQYYCQWSDWPELCQYDLLSFEEKIYFSLCKCSAAFGNRDRIQTRVLDMLIPDYREGMDALNQRKKRPGKTTEKLPSYTRLKTFLELVEVQGTQVVLVAMPVPEEYEFDRHFLETVENSSAVLVDCRTVNGLKEEMFFDGLHMDAEAAKLYSRQLAAKTSQLLKTISLDSVPQLAKSSSGK